jgi:transcriptional regulator with XRE-family HTH domain
MPTTVEQLARKNREGLTLLLKLLAKLGTPHKEIAKQLGVSQPLVSAWVHSKRYMTPADQDWCYTTFVNALLKYWPQEDESKQRQLYPLMEALVETWRDANRLEEALSDDEALNALMDAYNHLRTQPILSAEDCYRLETAQSDFQALVQARYENKLNKEAWDKAREVLAKAKVILGPDPALTRPQPPRPRPRRGRSQRQLRRRGGSIHA